MASSERRGSLIYDPKARSLFFQLLVAVAIIAMIAIAVLNAAQNLADQGKEFGFDFLNRPSDIQILTTFGTWLTDYAPGEKRVWDVFLLGIANTLIVSFIGIIFATFWGFLLGIFRLSSNFVLRSFATFYIEILRNIPLLLQIFFWTAVLRLVAPRSPDYATLIPGLLQINNRGIFGPYFDAQPGFYLTFIAFIIGCVLAWLVRGWAKARQNRTGQTFPVFWVGLGLIIALTAGTFLATGKPMIVEWPNLITTGSKLKQGFEKGVGMVIMPEFLALLLALATYTAAFIAEIVRAGIQAVAKGQSEAAHALGLPGGLTLRKIILPQAMRVIIPPLTSQYLNLTKNSSLAAAIAYPELVAVFAGTMLNQVGRAIEIIAMVILVYLTISLITSLFMNWFNARMKLVER